MIHGANFYTDVRKAMRDQWVSLCGARNRAIVWSWDWDGATDVLRTRTPNPEPPGRGQLWPTVKKTHLLNPETPDALRLDEFWKTMCHVSGNQKPSMVMSGSARIVYQTPGLYEQDGLDHIAMQDVGLSRRGYTNVRVDRDALRLPYNHNNVYAPGYEDTARAKMDIVLQQIRYAQSKLSRELIFVFVDDIYASVLARMFASYPRLVPKHVVIHLVHFERSRPRRVLLSHTRKVTPRVLFSPY